MVNTASSLHSISKVLFGNTSSNSQKHFVKFATEMVAVKAGVSGNSHFPQFPAGNASLKIPSEWHFLFPFFPEIRESNFCDFQFPFPGVKKPSRSPLGQRDGDRLTLRTHQASTKQILGGEMNLFWSRSSLRIPELSSSRDRNTKQRTLS